MSVTIELLKSKELADEVEINASKIRTEPQAQPLKGKAVNHCCSTPQEPRTS